jgi:peptidoglycan/LPS O-acetylase OafA/YrhL
MSRRTVAPAGRLPMLDILRACAVLLVFGRHLMPLTSEGPRVVLRFAHTWRRAAVGTDIFFVLSGFLVAGLLFRDFQRSGNLHIGRFLVRRGFKIYPAYIFYLLMSVPVAMFVGQGAPTGGQVAVHSLFFQNYYPHFLEYWVHLWSLAVEEHFYIAIAAALLVGRIIGGTSENPFRWVPAAFVMTAVVCLAWRSALAVSLPFEFYRNYLPTHLRIDAPLFGVLIAYYFHFHREAFVQFTSRWRHFLWFAGIAGLLPAFCVGLENPFSYSAGFTLYYLSTGALIAAAVATPVDASRLVARISTFLATRSYSIYLWHMLTFLAVRRFFISYQPELGKIWLLNTIITVTAAVAVGSLMAMLVEFPVLRLRDRWFPSVKRAAQLPLSRREMPVESGSAELQTIA